MPKVIAEERIIKIKELSSKGLSQNIIAERLGVSQWTVQKYDPRKPGRGSRKHLRKSYD